MSDTKTNGDTAAAEIVPNPTLNEKSGMSEGDVESKEEVAHGTDQAHLEEMQRRHGRTDLVPLPSDSPLDPLNWPLWRKEVLLWTVAIQAMQGPFSCAFIIPAFGDFSAEFDKSINTSAFLTSVGIVFLGVAPFFWTPLSERYGRRPIYLVSTLVAAICTLGGAFCHSYGALMTTRVFQAIFISPALSIGASTVSEMFFVHQKGQKMGTWVLMVTIGPSIGPILCSFLIQDRGWRSAFFLVAAIQFALFFMHLFFGPETMYPNRPAPGAGTSTAGKGGPMIQTRRDQYWRFRRYDPTPFNVYEFVRPLFVATRPVVSLAAWANALTFTYTNVVMTVYVPQLFGEIFQLLPGPVGLQFISLLIGAILGEQFAGRGGDKLMSWRTRRAGGTRVPEFRLGFLVPGFVLAIVGIIIWGVQLQNATPGKWNVTPDVGSAIAIFGQQLVSSVCTTYAFDSYPADTRDISTYIAFIRQTYAFIGPFYAGPGFVNLGPAKMSGLLAGLTGLGMFMMLLCQFSGPRLRGVKA